MSRGQTPRHRHDGPLRTGGGLAQAKRRGGCRAGSCGHAATGEPPGIDDASEPRRVALQAGPGTLPGRADEAQRWQARRAETVLAAPVGRPTRRSRRLGRQRKASQGTLAALAAAPPVSHSEAADRPSELSYPTPAPGPRDAAPGRGGSCFGSIRRVARLVRGPAGSTTTVRTRARAGAAAGHRRQGARGRALRDGSPTGQRRRRPAARPRRGHRPQTAWSGRLRSPPGRCRALSSRPEPRATSRAPLTTLDPAVAARTGWWRNPLRDVRGPVVHQLPTPVEQVGAPVGGLDAVVVDVRKRELAHLVLRVNALRRPVLEAGAEPVRHGVDAGSADHVAERGDRQRASGRRRGWQQRTGKCDALPEGHAKAPPDGQGPRTNNYR